MKNSTPMSSSEKSMAAEGAYGTHMKMSDSMGPKIKGTGVGTLPTKAATDANMDKKGE